MSGLSDEDRELLDPFVRDGVHDSSCTRGCFADHGTADDLAAAVQAIVTRAVNEALKDAAARVDAIPGCDCRNEYCSNRRTWPNVREAIVRTRQPNA